MPSIFNDTQLARLPSAPAARQQCQIGESRIDAMPTIFTHTQLARLAAPAARQ